jgi:hypothetical protein
VEKGRSAMEISDRNCTDKYVLGCQVNSLNAFNKKKLAQINYIGKSVLMRKKLPFFVRQKTLFVIK